MHEEPEPSSTTNRVEGEADTVAQLGSNYGNVGFFRGNSFVLSLGPRWTVMILVCLLVIAASVTVVLVRNAPSTSSPPDSSVSLSPEQWATWEHSKDGAQASEAAFTVTVQGREAASNVAITGVRVKILEKRPPLKGDVALPAVRWAGLLALHGRGPGQPAARQLSRRPGLRDGR
ncbi:hypothetical protein ACFOWZ_23150 [Lentzea rhizosphaerae]|uniref:Uncharacterized protein n=1 Tax=Lentzea rhizosphaerae TaxID=2041025 RepID=A0ABV8BXD3_9PSEU